MICLNCRAAGNLTGTNAPTPAIESTHALCKGGTWCDCQHVLPPEKL